MKTSLLLYYIVFLFSLGAFVMLATSLTTEYMATATIVNAQEQEAMGSIHFGILRGSKLLTNDPEAEVQEFFVFKEYKDSVHPLIVYTSILTTGFAIISSFLATILSLINIINVTKHTKLSSAVGPMTLGFYSILGAGLSSVTLILFTSMLFGTLDGDVAGKTERDQGYSSDDLSLGYSFWIHVAGIALLALNCGTIILAESYKDPEMSRKDVGVPRLMRSTKTEDAF